MRGSFRVEIIGDSLYAIWGIGPLYLIGTPRPLRGKTPSKARLKRCKQELEQIYNNFHKMTYEFAVKNLQVALYDL